MRATAPLKQWQIEDSKRLKLLFNKNATLSQLEFGSRYDIGSQGMVWQYLNGRTPLNLKVAVKFAEALRCDVADFSPTLAQELSRLATHSAAGLAGQEHPLPHAVSQRNEMTADETAVLKLYRGLCDDQKALLMDIGNVIRAAKRRQKARQTAMLANDDPLQDAPHPEH